MAAVAEREEEEAEAAAEDGRIIFKAEGACPWGRFFVRMI
jgi:hypothetical protein